MLTFHVSALSSGVSPPLCTRPHHSSVSPASTSATTSNRQSTTSNRPGTIGNRPGTTSNRGSTVSSRTDEPQDQGFRSLVKNLLFGAASSLDHRGDTTCLKCRGAGTTDCPTCKGAGFKRDSKNDNPLKKTAQAMKTALGMHTVKGETHLLTNRCMRCHGFGREPCLVCEGRGFRSPRVKMASGRH